METRNRKSSKRRIEKYQDNPKNEHKQVVGFMDKQTRENLGIASRPHFAKNKADVKSSEH